MFSRYFVFVIFFAYLSPQSWRHCSCVQQVGVYVPFFPQSDFGFSYPAVPYLVFLRSLIFCDGEYYNQAYSDVLMAVLQYTGFEVLADL